MKIFQTKMSYHEIKTVYQNCIAERNTYHLDFDESNKKYNAIASALKPDEPLYERIYRVITDCDESLKSYRIQRAGINLYLPSTKMYYHYDGPVITALLYINPNTNIEDGGETQFIVDDEIVSVAPKPGRLVVFDGDIRHTATSFSHIPRITFYFKFLKNN